MASTSPYIMDIVRNNHTTPPAFILAADVAEVVLTLSFVNNDGYWVEHGR